MKNYPKAEKGIWKKKIIFSPVINFVTVAVTIIDKFEVIRLRENKNLKMRW